MKKKYINPEMEVIEIKTTCMLAASLPKSDTEITDSGEILAPGQTDIDMNFAEQYSICFVVERPLLHHEAVVFVLEIATINSKFHNYASYCNYYISY